MISNYSSQRIWLEHLSLILEIFIKTSDELKDTQKEASADGINGDGALEKIPEEDNENEDEELLPL